MPSSFAIRIMVRRLDYLVTVYFDGTFGVDGLLSTHGRMSSGMAKACCPTRSTKCYLASVVGSRDVTGAGGRTFGTPITVEDIAPTILQALDVRATRSPHPVAPSCLIF